MNSKILCATVVGLVFMTNYSFASDGRKEMRSPTVQSAATGIPTQPVVANKDAVQSAIAANPAAPSPVVPPSATPTQVPTSPQAPTTQTPTPQTPTPQSPAALQAPGPQAQAPPPAVPVDPLVVARQNVSAAIQAFENVRTEIKGWNNRLMAECDGWIQSLDMVQNQIMRPGPIDMQTYNMLNNIYTRVLTEYNARVVTATQEMTTYSQRYSATATTWFNAIQQLPPAERETWNHLYSISYREDRQEAPFRPGHQNLLRVEGFLEATSFRLRGLLQQFRNGQLGIANS